MKNLIQSRIIEVTVLKATNAHGTRIKLTEQHIKKESLIIDWNHEHNNAQDVARAYLASIGVNVIAQGETVEGYVMVSDSWSYKTDGFIHIDGAKDPLI